MSTRLGATIRTRREDMGLTLTEAAARMGVSKGYLSQIETAKIHRPELDRMRQVADVLDLPIMDLLIASGQLTHDDLNAVGKTTIRPMAPGSEPVNALINLVDWSRCDRVLVMQAILGAWINAPASADIEQ